MCVCVCVCCACGVCVCVLRLGRLGMHRQLGGLLLRLPAPLHAAAVSQQPDVCPSGGHRHPQPLPAGGVRLHLHHVLLYREFSLNPLNRTVADRGTPVDKLNPAWLGVELDSVALGNGLFLVCCYLSHEQCCCTLRC